MSSAASYSSLSSSGPGDLAQPRLPRNRNQLKSFWDGQDVCHTEDDDHYDHGVGAAQTGQLRHKDYRECSIDLLDLGEELFEHERG